ncbi:MAG: alcohol dehydrogenase catalytic domain-containing protein [Bradymonadales bacterium]|nr:alcohol dehydrogenase catalytic domain-containing protein [Bradymonadales bacterium]
MRVAMYYSNRDVRLEEMDRPTIGPGEVLLKVQAAGICGSDLMEWYRRHKVPLVLGHEVAGDVVEIGEGVTTVQLGQRIAASHHVPCNTCHYCLSGHDTACETLRRTNFYPGGFAEYVRLPAINVDRGIYPLPEEMSYEEGTFAEPLGCVVRGQRLAGFQPGQNVLVIGAGIAGILHVALARALGAHRVVAVDVQPRRLEMALQFGAHAAFLATEACPSRLREVFDGLLADRVVVSTGAVGAIIQAFDCVERGGVVLLFAPTDEGVTVPVDINRLFWRTEVTVTTSYAANRSDHLEALRLISGGMVPVARMITHRLGLAESQTGFGLVAQAADSLKVILYPQR